MGLPCLYGKDILYFFWAGYELLFELSGTCQLLIYADDVSLIGENVNTSKKTTESVRQ